MSKTQIPTGGITADAINGTLIADDAINSEHYTDASIDTAHIGDNQVTAAKATGVGNLVKIGTVATDNSNVSALTIDNCFSSTYDSYRIVGYHNLTTGGAHQYFRWRTGGASGSSYTTANYMWINHGYYLLTNNNAGTYINKNGAQDTGRLASDVKSDGNSAYLNFDLIVSDPTTSTMSRAMVTGTSTVRQNTDYRFTAHHVGITNDADVNATGFQLTVSTGNISYGRVTVYGLVHA